LTCQEFHQDVKYKWGERPLWFGIDKASTYSPISEGYWGILEDWAEPDTKKKIFLGKDRSQVFDRMKMVLSF